MHRFPSACAAFALLAACGTASAPGPVEVTSSADLHDAGVDALEVADDASPVAIDAAADATSADAQAGDSDGAVQACPASPCATGQTCRPDGTCCTPACQDQCGGLPDGCGGTCSQECVGICTVPTVAPTPLYRAFSFQPLGNVANNVGCPVAIGVTPDGTHVTDFSNSSGYGAGNATALAFVADELVGKAQTLGLLAGQASGAGCTSGAAGCTLKLWSSAFNPYGLPGICPARGLLERDPSAETATFRQAPDSKVPSFTPLFLFGGPVASLAPWVRVHKLLAVPSTNPSLPGLLCGAVGKADLQTALAKLTAQQQQDSSVGLLKQWLIGHEPGIDLDGDGEGDAYPFAFTLGIALAGPSTIAK